MFFAHRTVSAAAALSLVFIALSACSQSPRPVEAADTRAAPPSATPPDDFWLSITILGPVRTSPAAYAILPRSLRPGRYIVEPDRVLRVALGTGAKDAYFPPQTRQLTRLEFAELWQVAAGAGGAGFLDAGHPNAANGNGEVDPETIEGKTVYVISTHGAARRQLIVLETDPECGPACEKAKSVVEWMAGKAWVASPAANEGK